MAPLNQENEALTTRLNRTSRLPRVKIGQHHHHANLTTSMDMNSFNVSATLNVFRLIAKPALCLPHATIPTFQQLPIPLNKAFEKYQGVDIKAVVLDKDDCFAVPKSNSIHKPYEVSSIFPLSCIEFDFRLGNECTYDL